MSLRDSLIVADDELNTWPVKNRTTRKDKAELLFLLRAKARHFNRVHAESSRIDMDGAAEASLFDVLYRSRRCHESYEQVGQ